MSTILSAHTSSTDIPGAQSELFDLLALFSNDKNKNKVSYVPVKDGEVKDVTAAIISLKDLRLFHFCGHSGQSALNFRGEDFNSGYLADLFNAISSRKLLHCVFLNGCENEEIVNKLSAVPVVIGTRSKIEDAAAGQFSKDFFSSLIEGEATYRQAFNEAKTKGKIPESKITSTRGEGGGDEFDDKHPLNDYFIVENNPKIADSQFPFHRVKNWSKLLFFAVAVVILFSGFLLREPIKKILWGFECPDVRTEEGKCSFAIGDFTTDSDMEFSKWLTGKIQAANFFDKYFTYADVGDFNKYINGTKVNRDELPERCGYDFNLTGSFNEEVDQFKAEFHIMPKVDGTHELDTFSYYVKSIGSLGNLITKLNPESADQFLLYELCIQCGLKKNIPELNETLRKFAFSLDSSRHTTTYQRLYYDMATVHLKYGDSSSALLALERSAKAVKNDFALASIERVIDLSSADQYALRNYETHSLLISALGDRVQNPKLYEMHAAVGAYKKGQDKVRFDRAMLVLKHKDGRLNEYKSIAIADFEYLQKIGYPPGDFSKEIAALKGEGPVPVNDFHFYGKVVSGKSPIAGASLSYPGGKTSTNSNGEFDFGTLTRNEVVGNTLLVRKDGYWDQRIEIKDEASITINLKSRSAPSLKVALQAVKMNEKEFEKLIEALQEEGYNPKSKLTVNYEASPSGFSTNASIFYVRDDFKDEATMLAGQITGWSGTKFDVRLWKPQGKAVKSLAPDADIIIQWVQAAKLFQLDGNVFTPRNTPVQGATLFYGKSRAFTDVNGYFDFGNFAEADVVGKTLLISSIGFQNQKVIIDEKTIGHIILQPVPPTKELVSIRGGVFTESGTALQRASVTFRNNTKYTDANGQFDFGEIEKSTLAEDMISVSMKGYSDKDVGVYGNDFDKIILSREQAEPIVILQALAVPEDRYFSLIKFLESQGYKVDVDRSSNKQMHVALSLYSMEIYYHDPYSKYADKLSVQLNEWFRNDLKIRLIPVNSSVYGVSDVNEDITIRFRWQ